MPGENMRLKSDFIRFYKQQFAKLKKIGIGKQTEHGVVVTQMLLDTTERRMTELMVKDLKKKVRKELKV
ncbi:MAG: hypothetical protein GOVbin2066_27 [Prokaryotic dsDNA virus sp.]|nr:MAG: hypothetical protein GOVbin2066_27 [Prokaryotic dsDNA virus sp.]|tara:strand:+ start:93 stop:299 length:207 start_codon:yes stop_codon:yes gene_type:complete